MRIWLARRLAPEVFKDAERYDYMRRRLQDVRDWCSYEFPEAGKAVVWALRSTRAYFMPAAEFNDLVEGGDYEAALVGDISNFREMLRRERDNPTTEAPKTQGGER